MALGIMLTALASISVVSAGSAVISNTVIKDSLTVPKFDSGYLLASAQREPLKSIRLRSAKIADVMRWLEENGYNFVVNDGDIDAKKTISLSITNQNVGSIANAIALALGGHWESSNGIHVYRKEPSPMNWFMAPSGDRPPVDFEFKAPPPLRGDAMQAPDVQKYMQNLFGQTGKLPPGKPMPDQPTGPDVQKFLKDTFGNTFSGQDGQPMAGLPGGVDVQKILKDAFGGVFPGQQGQDANPDVQKMMKEIFGPDFQKKLQDAIGKKDQQQFGPDFEKRIEALFGPDFEKRVEALAEKYAKEADKNPKTFGSPKAPNINLDAFMKSLTPDQKDQIKKVGYLWYNDLSSDQKQMFDNVHGKFDIELKSGGDAVRIRRN